MASMSSDAAPVKSTRTRRTRTRKPVERSARLDICPFDDYGLLTLTIDGIPSTYGIRAIPADEGQGFALTKPDGTTYHVCLGADLAHSTCECAGACRWSHCKHLESLLALRAAGKLAELPGTAPAPAVVGTVPTPSVEWEAA